MKYLLFFAMLFSSLVTQGQELIEREWSTELPVFVVDIEKTEDGSIYLAASIYDNTTDTAASIALKFNAELEMEWARQIKTFNDDDFGSVTELADGNLLFGGGLGAFFSPLLGGSLYEVDPQGNILWSRIYPGSDDDRVEDIFELENGDLILAVRRGVSGQPTRYLHTNSTGNIIDQFTLSLGSQFMRPTSHYFDGNNIYSVSRVFDNKLGYDVLLFAAFNLDEVIWAKIIDPGLDFNSALIYPNPQGGFTILGQLVDPDSFFGGQDIWLLNTDNEGNTNWSKRFYRQGNGFSEWANGIFFQDNGGFNMSCNFQIDGGFVPVFSQFDENGNLSWARESAGSTLGYLGTLSDDFSNLVLIGGRSVNGGYGMGLTTIEGDLACGSSKIEIQIDDLSTFSTDVNLTIGESDLEENLEDFTVHNLVYESTDLCSSALSTSEQVDSEVLIYPNPAKNYFLIDEAPSHSKIVILDHSGRVVHEHIIKSDQERIDVEHLEIGVYFILINNSQMRRLVIN